MSYICVCIYKYIYILYVRKNHTPSVRTFLLIDFSQEFSQKKHAQVGVVVEVLPSGNLRIQCGGSLLEAQERSSSQAELPIEQRSKTPVVLGDLLGIILHDLNGIYNKPV